jgi:hypothetical protein
MNADSLQFDAAEAKVIAHAANSDVTRRRIRLSVLFPLFLIGLTLALFWRDAQPRILLWFYVAYIFINMFEKIGYGIAVLAYKSVVRKLLARVNELEGRSTAG